MAKQYSDDEWGMINSLLERNPALFGVPERRDKSIVMASWNIRKFGKEDGHSEHARKLYARFAQNCDFIAIQEIMTDMFSMRDLCRRMNELVPDADYKVLASDVTGKAPGKRGNAERLGFIYDRNKIEHTEFASDISFDRSEVIKNVNKSIAVLRDKVIEETSGDSVMARAKSVFGKLLDFTGFEAAKMKDFVDFIRSPHFATFKVLGDEASYELSIVNAHILYGNSKAREKEFLAMLEWVFLVAGRDADIAMMMGDFNLDFGKDNLFRRNAIKAFLKEVNETRAQQIQTNFPFMDAHPQFGEFKTNSREKETFDHIAFIHQDPRLPFEKHNQFAGEMGSDNFDYGMFNFVKLIRQAGLIPQDADGKEDFTKFEHDVSDHMPIWVRMSVPHKGQRELKS